MTRLIVRLQRLWWLWLLLAAAPLAAQVTTQDAPPHHARITAIVAAPDDAPAGGGLPNPVNSVWETTGTTTDYMPAATYYLTWEVDAMDPSADSWIRLRVRCAWEDPVFGTWQGTTISTYRYRDN